MNSSPTLIAIPGRPTPLPNRSSHVDKPANTYLRIKRKRSADPIDCILIESSGNQKRPKTSKLFRRVHSHNAIQQSPPSQPKSFIYQVAEAKSHRNTDDNSVIVDLTLSSSSSDLDESTQATFPPAANDDHLYDIFVPTTFDFLVQSELAAPSVAKLDFNPSVHGHELEILFSDDDSDACGGDDDVDSNAESYYGNDYPDEDEDALLWDSMLKNSRYNSDHELIDSDSDASVQLDSQQECTDDYDEEVMDPDTILKIFNLSLSDV